MVSEQLHVETEPWATGSSEATAEHAELTELKINPLVPDPCPLRSLWFLSGAQWRRLRVIELTGKGTYDIDVATKQECSCGEPD